MPWGISFYDFHPGGYYFLVKFPRLERTASNAERNVLPEQTEEEPCE